MVVVGTEVFFLLAAVAARAAVVARAEVLLLAVVESIVDAVVVDGADGSDGSGRRR